MPVNRHGTAENIEALRAKGRELPLYKIPTEHIDRLLRSLLECGLAPRTVSKAIVATFGLV